MYLSRSFLSAMLICLYGTSSTLVLHSSAALSGFNEPTKSAVSSELRGMAARGQLGINLNTSGYREHIKRLYESTNFAPLWMKGDEPTSQARYMIEAFRASRFKGLNPSDY